MRACCQTAKQITAQNIGRSLEGRSDGSGALELGSGERPSCRSGMAVCVSAHKEASRRWHHGPTSVEVLMVPAIQPRHWHVIWLRTGCGSPRR